MSQDKSENNAPILNPTFLQAVRDEASKHAKAGNSDRQPIYRFVPEEDETIEPAGKNQQLKTEIASKRAELDRIQHLLDTLLPVKPTIDPAGIAAKKSLVNELRMQRLAIQMALISGRGEYDDNDLLEVDKQLAELNDVLAEKRQVDATNHFLEKRNAQIEEARCKKQLLEEELANLIYQHTLRIAVNKAEDYLTALNAAHEIRVELLAMAELTIDSDLLASMDLGAELPKPKGFYPFDSLETESFRVCKEDIEKAIDYIKEELAL